jgi:ATP-dependent Clp protease ATP-binding subunit ClpA
MKKEVTISKLLGVSQLEISILLKINRSQWSMYESDDRHLPNDALSLMNEMLKHVQNKNDKQLKMQELSTQQQDKKKETLKALLKENDYQQQTIERKIEKIEKNQAFVVARFQLLDFLNNHTNKKEEHPELLQRMEDKAEDKAEQNDMATLITHQIKQEVLKYEEELLKDALEGLVPENVVVKK